MKTLLLVTLALASFASSMNGQVLFPERPQITPPQILRCFKITKAHNIVRYEMAEPSGVWTGMFVADGAGRLVAFHLRKRDEWVVCVERFGDSWVEPTDVAIRPENKHGLDVAVWTAFFKRWVTSVPILIDGFQGFRGIALESDVVWRREVGLVTNDRSGVVRLRNVKTDEQRLINECDFGILPPVGKQFRIGMSCGLYYAVVGSDDDSKSFVIIAQALEGS